MNYKNGPGRPQRVCAMTEVPKEISPVDSSQAPVEKTAATAPTLSPVTVTAEAEKSINVEVKEASFSITTAEGKTGLFKNQVVKPAFQKAGA